MEAPFSIISPCIFLNKALRVGKAWKDIREVDAVLAHIALPLRFIPFKPHGLLYVQSVCTIKYFHKLGSCPSILRIIATAENQVASLRFTDLKGGTRDDARPAS